MKFILTNHLCRYCGNGRVLVNSEANVTGGGNTVYQCACCETSGNSICWCGKTIMRGGKIPYQTLCVCLEDKEKVESLKKDFWHQKTSHYKLAVFWKPIS